MDRSQPKVLEEFRDRLVGVGWVTDLFVGGSVATGDYRHGVSDLDLVALVDGPMDVDRTRTVAMVHRQLDATTARGLHLGCVYVDSARLTAVARKHPTWTHGRLIDRILSGVARAELVQHGFALHGRAPAEVLPPMGPSEVRDAVRAELAGYWTWAARRPWLWLDNASADLALVTMARARHALATGELITKAAAINRLDGPPALLAQVQARRNGDPVTSPRLRTALEAWRSVRATVGAAEAANN